MLQEGDRSWQPPPHPDRSCSSGALLLANNTGHLGCCMRVGGTESGLHHDSLFHPAMLLHLWAHPGAGMQVLEAPSEKQALQNFRWCTCGAGEGVVRNCGMSVLCPETKLLHWLGYQSTNHSACACQVRAEPVFLCGAKSAVNKQLKTQYNPNTLLGYEVAPLLIHAKRIINHLLSTVKVVWCLHFPSLEWHAFISAYNQFSFLVSMYQGPSAYNWSIIPLRSA